MKKIEFSEPLCKGATAFDRIAFLQEKIRESDDSEIVIRMENGGRTGLTFVFLIGCLPLYAEKFNKKLRILVTPKIYRLLSRINVIDYYQPPTLASDSYSIDQNNLLKQPAFKKIQTATDIIAFVNTIQMEAPIQLTEEAQELLTSRIGEVYMNALEHSSANIVIGGKYFKFQKNKYCFSCYDDGIGIPMKVNGFFKDNGVNMISDKEAIEWALQKGHSTSENDVIPRGVGLDLLRSFAKSNKAAIRICSGSTLYSLTSSGKEGYLSLNHSFDGTLFEMDLFSDSISSD